MKQPWCRRFGLTKRRSSLVTDATGLLNAAYNPNSILPHKVDYITSERRLIDCYYKYMEGGWRYLGVRYRQCAQMPTT